MEDDRETPCLPPQLGPLLPPGVDGCRWYRDRVGEAGAAVYRVHDPADGSDRYLKHRLSDLAHDVADEASRMRWLAAHLPVPTLLHNVMTPAEAVLLSTAMPGRTAWQLLTERPDTQGAVVDAIADFLKRLHANPVADCPFESGHALRMRKARDRIDAGLVDTEGFDEDRLGWTAQQVWDAMTDLLPLPIERVVTHGDFSLDNILVEGVAVAGCIDLGRVGVADRYQDLAILANCLDEFHRALRTRLFHRYGIDTPDADRLAFRLMLDEMF